MKRVHGSRSYPHIVGFYGGFILDGTYDILLEYADKGTLEEYLASTPPPCTARDIITFWQSFLRVTLGLSRIHGTRESSTEGPQIFQGCVTSFNLTRAHGLLEQLASRHQTLEHPHQKSRGRFHLRFRVQTRGPWTEPLYKEPFGGNGEHRYGCSWDTCLRYIFFPSLELTKADRFQAPQNATGLMLPSMGSLSVSSKV